MPALPTCWDFLSFGFINLKGLYATMEQTVCAAAGIYPTGHLGWSPGWEEVCYPLENPLARMPPMRWAQFLLIGHASIAYMCVSKGCYVLPLLLSFGPFYNGWLFWLCNSTQHVGMHHGGGSSKVAKVTDFRLTTRTFYIKSWLLRCWYWNMCYHIEHHMYAAVPCYNLQELHEAIKHDLPPTPDGIIAVWRQIYGVVSKQRLDPSYVMPIHLPHSESSGGTTTVN